VTDSDDAKAVKGGTIAPSCGCQMPLYAYFVSCESLNFGLILSEFWHFLMKRFAFGYSLYQQERTQALLYATFGTKDCGLGIFRF
jgi:hypothetical protein